MTQDHIQFMQKQQDDLVKAYGLLKEQEEIIRQLIALLEEKEMKFVDGMEGAKEALLRQALWVLWNLTPTQIAVVKVINGNPELSAKDIGLRANTGEETVEKVKQKIKKLPFMENLDYIQAAQKICSSLNLK